MAKSHRSPRASVPARQSAKEDKETFWQGKTSNMERTRGVGGSRKMFQLIKQVAGKGLGGTNESTVDIDGNHNRLASSVIKTEVLKVESRESYEMEPNDERYSKSQEH